MDASDSTVGTNPTRQFDQIRKYSNTSLEIQSNVDANYLKEISKCPQKTSDPKTKRFKRDMCRCVIDEAYYATKTCCLNNEDKNEFEIFGQYVACKIRKLSTSYAKSAVQYHINKILYHAELGQYDRPPQTRFNTYRFNTIF